jgi:hypothetical protein
MDQFSLSTPKTDPYAVSGTEYLPVTIASMRIQKQHYDYKLSAVLRVTDQVQQM